MLHRRQNRFGAAASPAFSTSSRCSSPAGYVIGAATGETTKDGFSLHGASALVLFAGIILYFYLGWKVLGGTLWQRILGAR